MARMGEEEDYCCDDDDCDVNSTDKDNNQPTASTTAPAMTATKTPRRPKRATIS
jgi:hypothetical protein